MSSMSSTPSRSGGGGILHLVFGAGVVDRLSDMVAWAVSVVLLGARIWLALPFFNAGLARVENWGSQTFLFQHIHPVPFLSPSLAAPVTTAGELALPVLLVIGLFGRFAGLGLAVMAATIYFIVGQTPQGIENGIAVASEQIPWILVGLLLFVTGPGRLSLDHLIRAKALDA